METTRLYIAVASVCLLFTTGLMGQRNWFTVGFVTFILGMMFTAALTVDWLIEGSQTTTATIWRDVLCNIPIAVALFSYIGWGMNQSRRANLIFWLAVAAHALMMRIFYL